MDLGQSETAAGATPPSCPSRSAHTSLTVLARLSKTIPFRRALIAGQEGKGTVPVSKGAALLMAGCALFAAAGCGGPADREATVSSVHSSTEVAGLHIEGNRYEVDSRPVMLRGVFYSSFEWACVHGGGNSDAPLTEAAVRALLSWRVNVVRLGVPEDCWLGINGAPIGSTVSSYRHALSDFVKLLHHNGIYTEIGLMYAAPGTNLSNVQAAMPDENHSPAFWKSFATFFKHEPDTIFGLYGEPKPDRSATPQPWECWQQGGTKCDVTYDGSPYLAAGMQQLVDTIRATGATQPISVSGVHAAADISEWLRYAPTDPLHQLGAEWHQYGLNLCWGTGDVAESNTTACWDDAVAQVARKVPLLNGELGEHLRLSTCAWTFMPTYLNWAEAHHVNYEVWKWGTGKPGTCYNMALIESFDGNPTPVYGQGYRDWLLTHSPH